MNGASLVYGALKVELCSPKRKGEVLISGSRVCYLTWKEGLCGYSHVRMKSDWIRMSL